MKVTYPIIAIKKGVMATIAKSVPSWHVPVYRLKFGDDNVHVVGKREVEVDENEETTPRAELLRMREQFGVESDTKQSFVDLAFGRGPEAVDRLDKLMSAAEKSGDPEDAQSAFDKERGFKPSKEVVEKRKAAYRDPVTGEKVESFDDVSLDQRTTYREPAKVEGKHEVVLSSTGPIKARNTASEKSIDDPLANTSRVQLERESRRGFAASEAKRAAEEARLAADAAAGRAAIDADPAGYGPEPERAARTSTRTTTRSGKAAKKSASRKSSK